MTATKGFAQTAECAAFAANHANVTKLVNEAYNACANLEGHPNQNEIDPIVISAIEHLKLVIEVAYPEGDSHEVD